MAQDLYLMWPGEVAGTPGEAGAEPALVRRLGEVVRALSSGPAVEGRGAQDGDYAVISFIGTTDGQPFEGGTSERMPLILGDERGLSRLFHAGGHQGVACFHGSRGHTRIGMELHRLGRSRGRDSEGAVAGGGAAGLSNGVQSSHPNPRRQEEGS